MKTTRKSSSRSKVNPYTVLRNWLPGGSCVFWNDGIHNPALYEPSIAESVAKDRSLTTFQPNV